MSSSLRFAHYPSGRASRLMTRGALTPTAAAPLCSLPRFVSANRVTQVRLQRHLMGCVPKQEDESVASGVFCHMNGVQLHHKSLWRLGFKVC